MGKGKGKGICYAYQSGYCDFGDGCRFSHDLGGGRASRFRHNDWSWNEQPRQSQHWAARPGAAKGIWGGGYAAGRGY